MESIFRHFTLSQMTDKSSGAFLRALAESKGCIVNSFTIATRLPNYRYASMFFSLKFLKQQDLDKFHSLGYETKAPENPEAR